MKNGDVFLHELECSNMIDGIFESRGGEFVLQKADGNTVYPPEMLMNAKTEVELAAKVLLACNRLNSKLVYVVVNPVVKEEQGEYIVKVSVMGSDVPLNIKGE